MPLNTRKQLRRAALRLLRGLAPIWSIDGHADSLRSSH
jgi:hypothetical protein